MASSVNTKHKRKRSDAAGAAPVPAASGTSKKAKTGDTEKDPAVHLARYQWSSSSSSGGGGAGGGGAVAVCSTTLPELKATLGKYGVAILPGVLNDTECKAMRDGMWDYLEHVTQNFDTPINRNEVESRKQMKHLFPKHSMLLQHFGVGHAQFIWDVRQNPKVIQPFLQIYDLKAADELLTSFDGASFHFPPEEYKNSRSGWFKNRWWFHTDQSPTRNGFECIQSWVTANPVNTGDATLAVLEGSHLLHGEFAKEFKLTEKNDWFKLDKESKHLEWFLNKGCRIRCLQCPAGSMVFWDSRTIHCGIEASKARPAPNTRCVAYVCMTPKKLCNSKGIQKRINAFEAHRMTTHWPHKPKLFGKLPQTYGAQVLDMVDIPDPQLTNTGRALVGYNTNDPTPGAGAAGAAPAAKK